MGDTDPTAQDVIDALRFVLMGQKDSAEIVKLVRALVDLAPDSLNDRGVALLMNLICEGSLKVALVDA